MFQRGGLIFCSIHNSPVRFINRVPVRTDIISHYKYMAEFSHALKKDPANKRIASTAKRLRDKEDYDEDESRKYAIKKQKFFIEKKMDDYDPSRYEENEEQTSAFPIKHKGTLYF